ncbi:hypothetical protein CkaCkLH20_11121 [Colletotrichum karsti]|uniref:NAD dependent epimerase/dehydratase n=1 Tax=Colletotrichum karsti TaxID=1095194 RepID=A0A9P6HVY1_9PEZI|nr:uncharacterized protein CkaCkLH20_11121 [Colletotrichum karsti]KAF9871474.1 hypothetical protein CkaCkLH20_11121 [Colletotrichum karsti]
MATVEERHPELFRPVSTESPRGKKRTVPMQVLCLGFPRTGTSSMCAALEKLGITCWHSTCFMSTNFADIEMWQEMVDRKFFSGGKGKPVGREEFDQLLHSYGAVSSDTPAVAFAEELIAAYPEAKVVLVEREIESWYKSYMRGIIGNMFDPFVLLVYHLDRFYVHPIGKIHTSVTAGWLDIWNKKDGAEKARAKYSQHYDLIRRVTPKERLLEFDLADGWGPLCEFLGKPIPEEPFPHLNEQAWLDEKVRIIAVNGLKSIGRKLAVVAGALAVAGVAWWWYQ